ncbi:hypothetical protein CJA_1335 [Cellvibrio japonicus Ueda107]|uniref:Uncharacterized protein n=1 Tax=Cellvibrio japonicus (strain Ueda107) TaxID=498211 RepID=B3PCX2_CELJU|nr:hypothetical protein CJA_1335 [Cellvibrio japonicus Ueda107]
MFWCKVVENYRVFYCQALVKHKSSGNNATPIVIPVFCEL